MTGALNEVANFYTKLVKILQCNKTSIWKIITSIYINLLHLCQMEKKIFALISDQNHLHCYTFFISSILTDLKTILINSE